MAKMDNQTKLMLFGFAGLSLAYATLFILKYRKATK